MKAYRAACIVLPSVLNGGEYVNLIIRPRMRSVHKYITNPISRDFTTWCRHIFTVFPIENPLPCPVLLFISLHPTIFFVRSDLLLHFVNWYIDQNILKVTYCYVFEVFFQYEPRQKCLVECFTCITMSILWPT